MLFCLFIFHAGVSFMETTIEPEIWLFKDSSTNIIFDGILGFVHAFRHPTFFIISGFVTEMMYRKYTGTVVMKRRFKRLFLPFLITTILAGPLIYALLGRVYGWDDPFSISVMFPATEDSTWSFGTTFVWFLYYLIIYNIIHYTYHQIVQKFPKEVKSTSNFKFVIQLTLLFLGVSVILYSWGQNTLFGLYSFFPDFGSIGGYFLYYIIGISLYRHLGDLERLKSLSWTFTILGLVGLTVYFILGFNILAAGGNTFSFNWGLMICSNFAGLFLSFGCLGLAMKYYTKPNKTITFISDSSYFLYLIHFPFVLIFLDVFIEYNWSAMAKFAMILSLTVITSLSINYIWVKAWKGKPPI
jgi:glucan biosynthesis protein C